MLSIIQESFVSFNHVRKYVNSVADDLVKLVQLSDLFFSTFILIVFFLLIKIFRFNKFQSFRYLTKISSSMMSNNAYPFSKHIMKHKFFLPYELISIWQIIQFGIKIWEPFIIPIAFMIKFTKDTLVTLLLPSIKSLGFPISSWQNFPIKKK